MVFPLKHPFSYGKPRNDQEKVCSEDVHRLGEVVISLKGKAPGTSWKINGWSVVILRGLHGISGSSMEFSHLVI